MYDLTDHNIPIKAYNFSTLMPRNDQVFSILAFLMFSTAASLLSLIFSGRSTTDFVYVYSSPYWVLCIVFFVSSCLQFVLSIVLFSFFSLLLSLFSRSLLFLQFSFFHHFHLLAILTDSGFYFGSLEREI